jgi:hypothetical protein
VTYTATVSVCSVDDGSDGYGPHNATTTWCSATTGTQDTTLDGEDYRRFTVTLTPASGTTATRSISMSTFVADSRSAGSGSSGSTGLGEGYAILMNPLCTGCSSAAWSNYAQIAPCKTFTTVSGTDKCNPTYDGTAGANYTANSITSVPVEAIFPSTVASTKFYLNRVSVYQTSYASNGGTWAPDELLGSGSAYGTTGRDWRYTWNLANTYPNQTPDGYYTIRAIGYDASGVQVGQPLLLSFWLNRFVPDMKYWTLNATRNQIGCTGTCPNLQTLPEIQWTPNFSSGCCRRDYDIQTFKVYRSGTTTPVICSFTEYLWRGSAGLWYTAFGHRVSQVACRDTATPAPATTGTVTYTLGATSFGPDGLATSEGGNAQTSPNVNSVNTTPTASCSPNCFGRPSQPASFSVGWGPVTGGVKFMTFTWTAPTTTAVAPSPRFDSSASPDCVANYRIYNTVNAAAAPAITDRLWRTSGGVANCPTTGAAGVTSYTAPMSGGYNAAKTKYWITSVDTFGNESAPRTATLAGP